MSSMLLGAAWAGLVLAVAVRHRPHRHRAGTLVGPATRPGRDVTVERLGRSVLRRPDAPPEDAARAGAVAIAVVLLAGPTVLAPALAPFTAAAAAGAWCLPSLRRRRRSAEAARAIEAGLPEVVDLLGVAVGAGLNVHLTVTVVARRAHGPVAAQLARALEATRAGVRLSDALEGLLVDDAATNHAMRPLVTALVDADRYGTSLTASLERLADDVRRTRQRRAEEAARRVPVKLLFPLVLCVLPAFALLTVAPVLAGSLRALRL